LLLAVAACAEPNGGGSVNPLHGDAKAAAQGEKLFGSMNCDGCHGAGATGFAAPSLVDGRWRYGGGDSTIFRSIASGRPRGMPAYGGMLAEGTIWQLITYVRSQPVPNAVPTEAWP
jgi:cytochrome c oxidase cbb3-type subunit 3